MSRGVTAAPGEGTLPLDEAREASDREGALPAWLRVLRAAWAATLTPSRSDWVRIAEEEARDPTLD